MHDHEAEFTDRPWKIAVGSVLLIERDMPKSFMHVRYEDVQDDPSRHITRMTTFLDSA